ncbi:hypothetical protein ACLMJK_004821 [Lecanora helva]
MANPLLPSAPASPPTPAPSPTPHQQSPTSWHLSADDGEDPILEEARNVFSTLDLKAKDKWLRSLVDLCDNQTLSLLHQIVSPRLKKDPFKVLPNELCFRILDFIDDPKTFVRAIQVSRRWREVVSDDQAWKTLGEKQWYRRMSSDSIGSTLTTSASASQVLYGQHMRPASPSRPFDNMSAIDENPAGLTAEPDPMQATNTVIKPKKTRPKSTHRSHFKHRYLVESAWRKGGVKTDRRITPDPGVVTSLHLTKKYIVVALDNSRIHVFNTKGDHQRTLQGHVMGVWAMVPWVDMLVSGGCDRDVRVWNMATGQSIHTLRGHTSTVRCLKMLNAKTAVSGSRDTTLRVWDLVTGTCQNTLMGHQASVRCLELHGDLVVSGSYDTTAKIWSISTGQCLRTLQGHFSQIYAIAFDGKRIATGSLDTSVRIWNPHDGTCQAILQGHTSLVGQLQMRGNTLVTGGSDGSVRVWSLTSFSPIHRLAAHDNSVTSLQFDDVRIVSGGSDGRVKIWDTNTGELIRELSQPAEAVWRVAFESEGCVVMACRGGRTIMEVWDFRPPADGDEEGGEGGMVMGSSSHQEGEHGGRELEMLDVDDDISAAAKEDAMIEAYATGGDEGDESEGMTD